MTTERELVKAKDIRHNAFSENLGKDEWIAVDSRGTPIARASDRDSVERAAPQHSGIFSAKDFTKANQPDKPQEGSDAPGLKHLGPDPTLVATQHQPEHTYEETLIAVEHGHDSAKSREENLEKAEAAVEAQKETPEGQHREETDKAQERAADPQATEIKEKVEDKLDKDDGKKTSRQRKPAAK